MVLTIGLDQSRNGAAAAADGNGAASELPRCLALYSLPEWETLEASLSRTGSFNTVQLLKSVLTEHLEEVQLDAQGRILIPPRLRQHAALEKRAVMVGQINKFHLWSEAAWQARQDALYAELGRVLESPPPELQELSGL